jgi:serine/threonine-protein kinase
MPRNVRRAAGSILVLAACGIAALGLLSGRRDRVEVSASARLAADSARRVIEQAWQTELRLAEQRVSEAIAQKPLQAAVNDRAERSNPGALQGKLESADWWRPIRDDFQVVRVIAGTGVIARQERGDIDLGAADSDLVATARMHRVASAVFAVGGRPLLAAAARIPPLTAAVPVLVLANPIDGTTLQRLYDRTGQALMVTPAEVAGAPDQRALVQRLAGREAEEVVVDPRGRWVATTVPLGPGVRLWTLKREALADTMGFRVDWSTGLLGVFLAIAGIVMFFGGRETIAAVSGVIKGETTLPFGAAARTRREVQTSRPRLRTVPPLPPLLDSPSPSGPPSPGETPRPPNVFGRYTLLEHLGQGGMADVYVAAAYGAEGFCRTFVLKRIRREMAHDKDAVSHFIDEACMQAGLVHSNIVPVFDFGVVDGEYFMTEEYVLGRDVSRVVDRQVDQTGGPFDPRLTYYIAHETLQALEYAHTKRDKEGKPLGIVHRDVSPGNVMVSLDGDVKLFDFGIVKSNARNTQTMLGLVKGNANFMSPEQARGEEVDHRSDLFSMGLVMYFCLTGRLFYQGTTDLEVIHKAATGPTDRDWEEIRRLPAPAGEILARALASDRRLRFQTAAEFARALAPHLTQKKAEAAALMQLLFGDDLRREAA